MKKRAAIETKSEAPIKMETKGLALDIKAVTEEGAFEGYLAFFNNRDSYEDIIQAGAFKKTLKDRGSKAFPLLWQHDRSKPIGSFTGKEDAKGLFISGKLALDVQQAKEAHSLMKMGAIDGLSIGYQPIKRVYEEQDGMTVRILQEVALKEGSVVTFPANDLSVITGVKAEEQAMKEIAEIMREAGFDEEKIAEAVKQIEAIAPADDQDAGGDEEPEDFTGILEALQNMTKAMQH